MLDRPLKDKYAVRWVTSPNPKDELYIMHYEVVDIVKAMMHASDQVIYTTKDIDEAKRYVDMLNKQDQLERS
jgi:hypothetical protein